MVAVAVAVVVVVVVVRGGKLSFGEHTFSTYYAQRFGQALGTARVCCVLGVLPKSSVGAECVCWACLKIGRESVCVLDFDLKMSTAALVL